MTAFSFGAPGIFDFLAAVSRRESRLGLVTLYLAMSVAIFPHVASADDQDVIDYREHIMKSMGEQVAAIGEILEQKVNPENFATHVQILAVTAATAKSAFEPKVLGGKAKPEVWLHWADFAKRLDALAAATADLAKIAKDGGIAAAAPKAQAALTCKSCHDTYRQPDK
jgi:cytochrome c556